MRKSPIRHQVKTHKRKGKIIHSFLRGHGQGTRHIANPTIRTEGTAKKSFEHYKVIFHYSNNRKEKIEVASNDADDALNLALKERKYKGLKPIKIEVIDGIGNVLGSIIGKVAGSASDAITAFRSEYSKNALERTKLDSARELSNAEQQKWIEDNAGRMIIRARKGDRTAQIWCEKYHIAWQQV